MAYDGTIPALGNLISNDIPAMQENFSLLESEGIVNTNKYWNDYADETWQQVIEE